MTRLFLASAAAFGFAGVAAGAFAVHALQRELPAERQQTFETGVRYLLWHALALFAVVWFRTAGSDTFAEALAGWSFIGGIALFSASLFAFFR